jgi:hypothetical protein
MRSMTPRLLAPHALAFKVVGARSSGVQAEEHGVAGAALAAHPDQASALCPSQLGRGFDST